MDRMARSMAEVGPKPAALDGKDPKDPDADPDDDDPDPFAPKEGT